MSENGRDEKGRFTQGNQFWRNIDPDDLGRNPKYKTPNELWEDSVKYFQMCDENPITSRETSVKGKITQVKDLEHKIPYTWQGLYVFLGVCDLEHYKTKPAFSEILTHMSNIIYNQKFTGASAGIFNSAIIIRDLGLANKEEANIKIDGLKSLTDSELDEQIKNAEKGG